METEHEQRSVELRDADVQGRRFRGYAAVFDAPWSDALIERMGYVESVARGAFRKALSRADDVPLLWQHDRRDVLATTKSGNLRLKEDGRGLLVEAELPKSALGEYVKEMIERGDVRGMSYGIETSPSDSIISRRDGMVHRSVANARRLLDVTITWEPSYDATSVELRAEGFAATPLQALIDGLEGQIDESAAAVSTSTAAQLRRHMAEILITELESGGVYS